MMSIKNNIDNNKGFSLIELMVVIAVMAVAVGLASLSLAMVNNANVNKAAYDFNSLLNQARAQSIAKGTDAGTLTLKVDNGSVLYKIGDASTTDGWEKLTTPAIDVEVVPYINTAAYDLHSGTAISGSVQLRFAPSGVVLDATSGQNICQVIFKRGNRKVGVIIYRETGKHDVVMY